MQEEAAAKKKKKFLWVFKWTVEKPVHEVLDAIRNMPCVDQVVVGDFQAFGNSDRFLEV